MIYSIKKPVTILSMDEARAKYIAAIIEMFILVCIATYLFSKQLAKFYLVEKKKTFREDRQSPGNAFSSGLLGKNPSDVFNGLIGQKITNIFKKFLSFLTPIFKIFTMVFSSFQHSINKLRSLLRPIRDFFKAAAEKFYSAISKYVIGAIYSLNKMRNGMRRSLSGFNLVFHSLEHTKNSLQSLVDSPPVKIAMALIKPIDWTIDKGSRLFCFNEELVLEKENLEKVYITCINVGDVLSDGSTVIAKQVFYKEEPLYKCISENLTYPIYVTGDHKVKYGNKYIDVKESSLFILSEKKSSVLYCISTDTGIINIEGILFKDYSESKNKYLNYTANSLILSKLNNDVNVAEYAAQVNELEHGFCGDTLIETANGLKSMKEVRIGDKLEDDNYVIGTVELHPEHFQFYEYNTIKVSSNMKVKEDGVWKNVEKCDSAIVSNEKPAKCLNIITSTGIIPVFYKQTFRDYCEIHDEFTNDKIDEILEYA